MLLNIFSRWVFFKQNYFQFTYLGTLGVITEVTLKIRPVPPVRKYASFVFPDFDHGVQFMRHVAREVSWRNLYWSFVIGHKRLSGFPKAILRFVNPTFVIYFTALPTSFIETDGQPAV